MTVALFLPVESAKGALAFAAGIETGRIPCLREYLDEHLARENFAKYPGGVSKLLGIFRVENGVATRVAEGAPRFLTGPQTGVRSLDCEACSLGSTLAGDAGRPPLASPLAEAEQARVSGKPLAGDAGLTDSTALAVSSVSTIERRDGACTSGDTRSEAA